MKNECAKLLAEIMTDLGVIPKDAVLDHKYRHEYRSKESLFDELRPRLAARGIFPAMSIREAIPCNGGIVLIVDVRFVHGESGSVVECSGVGEGRDKQDKATAKALTSAIRSFIDNQFMLGLESDDALYRDDRESKRPRQAEKKFDRRATEDWIFDELIAEGHTEETVAAYLDHHWLPEVARAEVLEDASDEAVRKFAKWIHQDPKTAAQKVEDRLREIGFYGEAEPAPEPDAY